MKLLFSDHAWEDYLYWQKRPAADEPHCIVTSARIHDGARTVAQLRAVSACLGKRSVAPSWLVAATTR